MLEALVDLLITEIVEVKPIDFDMDIVFYHYGAPPHYSREVINYLNNFPRSLDSSLTRLWCRGLREWST